MNTHFEGELSELKGVILKMGGLVEEAIRMAVEYMSNPGHEIKRSLIDIETAINRLHLTIDDICLKILAVQSPVARDLRFIMAVIKMNCDLERMGDQAFSIYRYAKTARRASDAPVIHDIMDMASEVQKMVNDALDAFVRSDTALARDVLVNDKKVNELRRKIYEDMIHALQANHEEAVQVFNLNIVARILERLGDHATNIAEDVIFIATGEDVRHSSLT